MGYTGAMFLASIVLAAPILLLSAIPFGILRRLRAVPSGWAGVPAYLLIACAGYAILFLYSSMDTLLLQPIQLQHRYLGRVEGHTLALRSCDHWGFQDPADEWVYVLDSAQAARFTDHCPKWDRFRNVIRCYILSRDNGRSFTSIWIEDGKLHLLDGFE